MPPLFLKVGQTIVGGKPTATSPVPFQAPYNAGTTQTLTDGAAVAVDPSLGQVGKIVCANNNARVFQLPTTVPAGTTFTIIISNTAGVAIPLTTFVAGYKAPAIVLPATGFQRAYLWLWDGTNAILLAQTAADVPN